MKAFVALSFNREHETAVVGVCETREDARRLVEQHRNEMLFWSRYAADGPDGGAALDDGRGDCVGHVLAFEFAGSAELRWLERDGAIYAPSAVYEDGGQPVVYQINCDGREWVATFDAAVLSKGTIESCLAACRKMEDQAILEAIQSDE